MQQVREFDTTPAPIAPPLIVPLILAPLAVYDPFPQVPVLRATQRKLELAVQEPVVDLCAVSHAILSDLGATLQIFRLIGTEYAGANDRPTRIDDCIVDLEVAQWFGAISATASSEDEAVCTMWHRARRLAEVAREIACSTDGFSPEQAYVVGLFYEIGRLPGVLGWDKTISSAANHRETGMLLADYWQLPRYFVDALCEHQGDRSSRWKTLLASASQKLERELLASVDPSSLV